MAAGVRILLWLVANLASVSHDPSSSTFEQPGLFAVVTPSQRRTRTSLMVAAEDGNGGSELCQPPSNGTLQEQCDYVSSTDSCAGGGYMEWTEFIACSANPDIKWVLVVIGVLWMLLLFVALSISADDFFSPNVAVLVAQLRISESLAGVTFVAFGNGAPDIFSSIASVLSTPQPKADLALGELIGGNIFVTCVVVAAIVLTRPLKASIFSTSHNLIFYLITLGWILFVFLFDDHVYIWQPIVLLVVYVLYIASFIGGQSIAKKRRGERRQSTTSKKSRGSSRRATLHSSNGICNGVAANGNGTIPNLSIIHGSTPETATMKDSALDLYRDDPSPTDGVLDKAPSLMLPGGMMKPLADSFLAAAAHADSRRASRLSFQIGNAFALPEDDAEEEEQDVVLFHNRVVHLEEARERGESLAVPSMPVPIHSVRLFLLDLWTHFRPFAYEDAEERAEHGKLSWAWTILTMPVQIALKLTIPLAEAPWSKPIAMVHSICSPVFFLFAIQQAGTAPFAGSPGLYVYSLIISALVIVLLFFATSADVSPRYYKHAYSFLGFVMAVAWIYAVSAEVVDVVTMLGVVSGIDQAVLGLTIVAWANSIGDMVTDIAVSRQGYPRMAMAAAIGGPLYNLLIGFGLPFTIALLKGSTVSVSFSGINMIMVVFLGASLCTSLVFLVVSRARLGRVYGLVLLVIYVAFMVLVVLQQSGVTKF